MKSKASLFLLLGFLLVSNWLPYLHAEGGTFIFVNSNSRAILDGRTGLPVEGGVAVAGLYYSTNLFDLPDPSVPTDSFQLAATKSVSDGGIIFGGTVEIPGTRLFQEVLLQVRVWYAGFATYEEALSDGRYPVGVSNLMGPVRLGGSIQPPFGLTTAGMMATTLWSPNGQNPPLARSASITLIENRQVNGQLFASDYDGDSVVFFLESPPVQGILSLNPDGRFLYEPFLNTTGSDRFTFRAFDGALESPTAVISLTIVANDSVGRLVFNNGPENPVLDGRTGLPVAMGEAVAGLYLTTNLTAVPRPDWPTDVFTLITTIPVTPTNDPLVSGLFNAGIVELIQTEPGTPVLLQVRVWTGEHATYEEAYHDPQALVAVSDLLGPLTLGGPNPPWPALADLEMLQPMILGSVPENLPPTGKETTFSTLQNTKLYSFVEGHDPEGAALQFELVEHPTLGTLLFTSSGQFSYEPGYNQTGTDSFTFVVRAESAVSDPTTVTIQVIPQLGSVLFENSAQSLVIDGRTGYPVGPNVATAGLYYTTNLNETPSPGLPGDPFMLVATTPIGNDPDPRVWGRFDGGIVEIPDTGPGQRIQLQVRLWTTAADSYAEAAKDPEALLGVSDRIDSLILGDKIHVNPSLAKAEELRSITLNYAQGNHPPVAIRANFYQEVGTSRQRQLTGSDPDGDDLEFILDSLPSFGTVVLSPNGQYQYDLPASAAAGTDRFTFKVSDGLFISEPAEVVITVLPAITYGGGTIGFNNGSSTLILDHQTGLPIATGLALAGLYYSTNLNAVSDPNQAKDEFALWRTVPIRNGIILGGSGAVAGTYPGQTIVVQVRVWSSAFGSYEDAFNNGAEILGASSVLRIFLSGGTVPAPSIVIAGFSGIITHTITLNHPPVGITAILPEVLFGHTDTHSYIISRNNVDATVTLDGSASSDEDGDPLSYFWYQGQDQLPLAEGQVATVTLPLGFYQVTLLVDDGTTNATGEIAFEILTAGDAVEWLISQLEESLLPRQQKQPLQSLLKAAVAAFDRGQFKTGTNQLNAFQNSLRAKLNKSDPATAERFIASAQIIIDAVKP